MYLLCLFLHAHCRNVALAIIQSDQWEAGLRHSDGQTTSFGRMIQQMPCKQNASLSVSITGMCTSSPIAAMTNNVYIYLQTCQGLQNLGVAAGSMSILALNSCRVPRPGLNSFFLQSSNLSRAEALISRTCSQSIHRSSS